MAGEMDVLCITSKHVRVLSMAKSERPLLGHEVCASGFEGVHLPGCLRTNADNQAKIADTTNLISENTAIQANETNTPKKKTKIKDPLKVKRADKLKKKPNMNG